ncbi:hypothetical protein SKAU_G00013420 [Synaphobranchus kaupii]|uniref:Uncharacterized protein n=1 Tax=Synaphobranchus kaupii TaxID=118154 RepID=A0A9Q1JDR2_SYNKA|nr:hypothetical protein SKAU_G00013420 [Synaphobranchus kaupii]
MAYLALACKQGHGPHARVSRLPPATSAFTGRRRTGSFFLFLGNKAFLFIRHHRGTPSQPADRGWEGRDRPAIECQRGCQRGVAPRRALRTQGSAEELYLQIEVQSGPRPARLFSQPAPAEVAGLHTGWTMRGGCRGGGLNRSASLAFQHRGPKRALARAARRTHRGQLAVTPKSVRLPARPRLHSPRNSVLPVILSRKE